LRAFQTVNLTDVKSLEVDADGSSKM